MFKFILLLSLFVLSRARMPFAPNTFARVLGVRGGEVHNLPTLSDVDVAIAQVRSIGERGGEFRGPRNVNSYICWICNRAHTFLVLKHLISPFFSNQPPLTAHPPPTDPPSGIQGW